MTSLSPLNYLAGAMLLLSMSPLYADVVVVVSAKNPTTSLTRSQVAHIFLGKSAMFPNGSLAMPLDQPEGVAIRNEFYSKVAGKSPAQLNAYWSKVIFAGDGQPPKAVANSEMVKKTLFNDPRGIGYLERSALDERVKIVFTP